MKWIDVVNKSKKLRFNARYVAGKLLPDMLYRHLRNHLLEHSCPWDEQEIRQRVDYCNQLVRPFRLENPVSMRTFQHKGNSAMQMDFRQALRYFDPETRFNFILGDTRDVPERPCFVKSRPAQGERSHSVLLRLDSARHFNFVRDPVHFENKRNRAIWRGAVCKRPLRVLLMDSYLGHSLCDVGDSDKRKRNSPGWVPFTPFSRQLEYKFIISLEGNDVATNTKWIMSSNSLCFMPEPRYETWFMEGRLIPGYHYVPLARDLNDLEEKIEYYSVHTREALDIIRHAHEHVSRFTNAARERIISLMVVQKYMDLCMNNQAENPVPDFALLTSMAPSETRPTFPLR